MKRALFIALRKVGHDKVNASLLKSLHRVSLGHDSFYSENSLCKSSSL